MGATTYWLLTDRLGSIQAVTDAAGAPVLSRTYRPYGETLSQNGKNTESRGWIGAEPLATESSRSSRS